MKDKRIKPLVLTVLIGILFYSGTGSKSRKGQIGGIVNVKVLSILL